MGSYIGFWNVVERSLKGIECILRKAARTLTLLGPHEMWDLYVYDWFGAAAVGSKMCTRIFVVDLAPSILQSSQ